MNTYTSGAFEDYDTEDVEGLLKDRSDESRKYFEDTLDELDELCDGVEEPRGQLEYIHYFYGENGVDEDTDEAYARSREKLYRLVSRLLRAYPEIKQYLDRIGYSEVQRAKFEDRVNFYVALKETIGRASADFIDGKLFSLSLGGKTPRATVCCLPSFRLSVTMAAEGGITMTTKDILFELRTKNGLSQDQLAEKVFVTRQAVSRWENGETVPNTDTLKLLSSLFNVSINTLLGAPRKLICQCCGMPLDDTLIGRNKDGTLNEDYCKWCYADGTYTYSDMDTLIDVCVPHMVSESLTEEQARSYMKQTLPRLDYWKRYEELSDGGQFEAFKKQLIEEINALHIEGMPRVESLNALVGSFVNLAYPLPSGVSVKFLDDQKTYLGTQLESAFGGERCFGILASMEFILICTYGKDAADPELVLYKKR